MSGVLLEYFCPLECEGGSALTISFKLLGNLSTFFFFFANHPWLLWDVHEHPFLPQAQTFLVVPLSSTHAHTQPSTEVSTCATLLLLFTLRDRNCEFRQLLLFSLPPLRRLRNSWILLGLIFVLFLELASAHNDNFLLNCFCCALPVSLPFQEDWLQSKYQTSTRCVS